jgi:hypothetical protein
MTITRALLFCLFLCAGAAAAAKDTAPKPYVWPPPPDEALIKRAQTAKTLSGLVLLEKHCDLSIESFFTSSPGTRRDEFIRLLVTTEQGAHRASLEINDDKDAKIESIEARTVAPDGRVTMADAKNDIHRSDVASLNNKDIFSSVATVNFPAPAVGAVLDLHVVTYREGAESFLMEPIGFEETPSLSTIFIVHINGGWPGCRWSVLVPSRQGITSTLENKGASTVQVTIPMFSPKRREPDTVPYYQRQPTLLCYINFADTRENTLNQTVSYQSSTVIDPRGRPSNFTWQDDAFTKWWVKWFQDHGKYVKEFVSKPGQAEDIDVKFVAPETLPLEERVQRLYAYVQHVIKVNPDAEDLTSLSAVMKKGEESYSQGNYLLSYLLDRAAIAHNDCCLLDRYYIPFSPIATNTYMYGFYSAVTVDIPGKGRVYLIPGDPSLPYACLSDEYQNSLAFWLEAGSMRVGLTPVNPPGADTMSYTYALQLEPDGGVKGSLRLLQTGAAGRSLDRWARYQAFRKEHPDKKDKTPEADRKAAVDKRLKEEFYIPGTKLLREDIALGQMPKTSSDPIELTCRVQAPGMAERLQDRWLLLANPVLAGFTSPFTEDERETPVWYDKGGQVTIAGTIKLPPGAKILELPKALDDSGPDRTRVSFSAQATEVDGAPALSVSLVYDRPLIVGSDRYKAWQYFQATLAKIADSRCVISLPGQASTGTLE